MPLMEVPERMLPDIPAPIEPLPPLAPVLPAPAWARAAPLRLRKTVPAVKEARSARVFMCFPFTLKFHHGGGADFAPAVWIAAVPAPPVSGGRLKLAVSSLFYPRRVMRKH